MIDHSWRDPIDPSPWAIGHPRYIRSDFESGHLWQRNDGFSATCPKETSVCADVVRSRFVSRVNQHCEFSCPYCEGRRVLVPASQVRGKRSDPQQARRIIEGRVTQQQQNTDEWQSDIDCGGTVRISRRVRSERRQCYWRWNMELLVGETWSCGFAGPRRCSWDAQGSK
jgi:hypothetical protein